MQVFYHMDMVKHSVTISNSLYPSCHIQTILILNEYQKKNFHIPSRQTIFVAPTSLTQIKGTDEWVKIKLAEMYVKSCKDFHYQLFINQSVFKQLIAYLNVIFGSIRYARHIILDNFQVYFQKFTEIAHKIICFLRKGHFLKSFLK